LGFYSFRNRRKANENVLIVGTSGKGKTNLMDLLISKYFDRFIVFNFKKGDLHLKARCEK
jgi:type IV secretory pathway VirB4 component